MAQKSKSIHVQLQGIRPLMFDRYPGDNKTKLPPEELMYLDHNQHLILPSLNVSSLLTAENSKSVCRTFFGKAGKEVWLGISSYVFITPFEIPIHDGEQPIIFTGFNEQIYVQIH